jgi:hypothetical protein
MLRGLGVLRHRSTLLRLITIQLEGRAAGAKRLPAINPN